VVGRELGRLSLELLTIVGAAIVVALTARRRLAAEHVRAAVAPAVAGLAVTLTIVQLFTASSKLRHLALRPVSARAGVEHCFTEQDAAARLPFVRWVKTRIGSHSQYALDYAGEPDLLCVYLVLLPSLPARVPSHADWIIAFGAPPPEMQRRIAARDPTVEQFAPGFALERNRR